MSLHLGYVHARRESVPRPDGRSRMRLLQPIPRGHCADGGTGCYGLSLLRVVGAHSPRRNGGDQRGGHAVLFRTGRRASAAQDPPDGDPVPLGYAAELVRRGRIFRQEDRRAVFPLCLGRCGGSGRPREGFHHDQRAAMRPARRTVQRCARAGGQTLHAGTFAVRAQSAVVPRRGCAYSARKGARRKGRHRSLRLGDLPRAGDKGVHCRRPPRFFRRAQGRADELHGRSGRCDLPRGLSARIL